MKSYTPTLDEINKEQERTGDGKIYIKKRLTLENIETDILGGNVDVESALLTLVRIMQGKQ